MTSEQDTLGVVDNKTSPKPRLLTKVIPYLTMTPNSPLNQMIPQSIVSRRMRKPMPNPLSTLKPVLKMPTNPSPMISRGVLVYQEEWRQTPDPQLKVVI
jgi:hypothetical protein